MEKSKTSVIAVIAVCLVALVVLAIFMPDTVFGVLTKFESIAQSVNGTTVAMEDMLLNLSSDFEMPSFKLDLDEIGETIDKIKPTLDISIIIIVAAVIAVIISCFFPPFSIITTGFFIYSAITVTSQTMGVYKELVASGSTNWQAAGACYLALFIALWFMFSASSVGLQGFVFKSSNFFTRLLLSLACALVGGAIFAAALAGLAVVVMGLGWAGGAMLFTIIASIWTALSAIGSAAVSGLN